MEEGEKEMMDEIEKRKSQHIEITLNQDVVGENITTGFERYRFIHEALPEIDFQEISCETVFLQKRMNVPFVISSMTGGTEKASLINQHLAEAAEECGWAMGLGSTRAAISEPSLAHTFQVRKFARNIPLFANLGAVQLNYGFGLEQCEKIIEMTEADALVLHLNSMQEIFQVNGDTNFKGLLLKIEKLCSQLSVPVGIKEVGWGIHGRLARKLFDIGVSFVDVAGAGGTSWSQVEKYRLNDEVKRKAAEAFADWGIPTSDAVIDVRNYCKKETIIASGGIKNGVEAAKAIALGANLVGFGRSILKEATESTEEVLKKFKQLEFELKASMFGIGVSSIQELMYTDRIQKR